MKGRGIHDYCNQMTSLTPSMLCTVSLRVLGVLSWMYGPGQSHGSRYGGQHQLLAQPPNMALNTPQTSWTPGVVGCFDKTRNAMRRDGMMIL
mmetsp:Transcript_23493/g.28422  ORF Transcript_23493/g.28422 Transcript_23493/m.28422 type:complete len:92 (+) Transcript_23493:792-1067(+)